MRETPNRRKLSKRWKMVACMSPLRKMGATTVRLKNTMNSKRERKLPGLAKTMKRVINLYNKNIPHELILILLADARAREAERMRRRSWQYIPHEVIIKILHRLPIKSIIRCSSVSKLWFNSIYRDPDFAATQLFHSLNNPHCRLLFNFVDVVNHADFVRHNFSFLDIKVGVNLDRVGSMLSIKSHHKDVVGHCNGLVCLTWRAPNPPFVIEVLHPSKREAFTIFPPTVDEGLRVQSFGFGFGSLMNEYKVVYIVGNIANNLEFKFLVMTLGTNIWREITVSSHQLGIFSKSAIYCNGYLYWRTTEPRGMLISFDLHYEKFQFIQIPAECVSAADEKKHQQLVHLLESKGSLCVARFEISLVGSCSDHQNCKVHLHTLKEDRINNKQLWMKETFLIPFLLPSTAGILGSSDQVLLHWFDGECFQLCNLHTKYVKVVRPPLHIKNKPPPLKDYHLNNHIENILSLRTFVPAGARRLFDFDRQAFFNERSRKSGAFLFRTCPKKKTGMEYYVLD